MQFLRQQDPYGTRAFVQFGIERGEVRDARLRQFVELLRGAVGVTSGSPEQPTPFRS
jgi:hypothetical protein